LDFDIFLIYTNTNNNGRVLGYGHGNKRKIVVRILSERDAADALSNIADEIEPTDFDQRFGSALRNEFFYCSSNLRILYHRQQPPPQVDTYTYHGLTAIQIDSARNST
jgi:hypothetical protein